MEALFMIDLCCGLKGASEAMRHRNWNVITVDIDPSFSPDILANVQTWSWRGQRPDLIWASPPCDEFSREFMPWARTGKPPDLSIVEGCRRIISEVRPRYWAIESTRGGSHFINSFLGKPAFMLYPYYLWGHLPPLPDGKLIFKHKELLSSTAKAERARIPYELSLRITIAIEQAIPLFDYVKGD